MRSSSQSNPKPHSGAWVDYARLDYCADLLAKGAEVRPSPNKGDVRLWLDGKAWMATTEATVKEARKQRELAV